MTNIVYLRKFLVEKVPIFSNFCSPRKQKKKVAGLVCKYETEATGTKRDIFKANVLGIRLC